MMHAATVPQAAAKAERMLQQADEKTRGAPEKEEQQQGGGAATTVVTIKENPVLWVKEKVRKAALPIAKSTSSALSVPCRWWRAWRVAAVLLTH